MRSIAAATAKVLDVEKELSELLIEAEENIEPGKREEFASKVELILLNTSIELIEVFSKEVLGQSDTNRSEINKKWHYLRERSELLRRRNQLVAPATPQEFEAALMWMTEQGGPEDLDILRALRGAPPFRSDNVDHLLNEAEQRIIVRTKDRQGERT